jgi:hypothetical protein
MPHSPRESLSTRHSTRLVSWLTTASLLFGVQVDALAAPAADPPVGAPESDTAKAESIFRQGQTKYETADYVGALELWTEAYGLVASTQENAAIKALLIFNLAQAHVKAFELDEDPIHLKQARSLLDSYRASLDLLYDDDETARIEEQGKVDAKLVEIANELEKVEAAKLEPVSEPAPEPESEPEPVDVAPKRPKPGNLLLFAGIGVTVLGAAGGGVVMTVGGVMGSKANQIEDLDPLDLDGREEQFARGMRGNALLITAAVVAGVLIPTGIALIAVGARRNAEARNHQPRTQARVPSLAPGFGPGQAGLVLRGRF